MRHSIRRLVATAATGGAVATTAAMAIIAPAAATTVVPDGAEQAVRVELHTLEPAAPAPGDTVEITGSITNVTDEDLRNVQALLRYDSRPLTARSDIARVTTEAGLHWGWRPGHIYDIVHDELTPGESAPFDLEFIVDTVCPDGEPASVPCLRLPADGVYAVGVDGNVTTADDDRHTGGTARTVVPWQIADGDPIDVALLWPIVGTPRIRDGALRETAAPNPTGTLGPAGEPTPDESTGADETPLPGDVNPPATTPELTRLLTAPGNAPVTWTVDPDTWSPDVAEAVRDARELMVLPPSVPDLGTLARVDRGLADSVATAVAGLQREFRPHWHGAGVRDTPARRDVAWPGAGVISEQALQAWANAGYDTVVLPRDAVAMTDGSARASLDLGGRQISAILTDPGLDSAIADNALPGGPSARSAALDLRQRWLAETALARGEPFRSRTTALVAAPPAGWQPPPEVIEAVLDVWTDTDWIEPAGVPAVSRTVPMRPTAAPAAVLRPLLTGSDGLPGDYARDVALLHDELARYHSLVGASDDASTDETSGSTADPPSADAPAAPSDTSGAAAGRAGSVAWRHDLDTARAEVAALREDIADAVAGVSVIVNPSNTLSGNTGVFPVNIANELAHAVTVRLEFDTANEDRLAIAPVEARVPGGQQQTVQVRAEAVANGEVPVSVQLATVDGAPLGGVQHTIVNATHYGTIGWFVVGGSAVLFAGGLSWRMLRGRRRSGP